MGTKSLVKTTGGVAAAESLESSTGEMLESSTGEMLESSTGELESSTGELESSTGELESSTGELESSAPELLAGRFARLAVGDFHPLAAAESCTGGLASAWLTAAAGASAWFGFGVVCYSNEAKTALLGVAPELLARHGAVSEEVAAAMCAGLLARGAGSCFAITGVAGPDGGSAAKPVGTVCFGWGAKGFGIRTTTQWFAGGRTEVREQAARFILQRTADALEEWGAAKG